MVIKADVQGSAEALADALSVLSTEHASVSVLRAGVGLVAWPCGTWAAVTLEGDYSGVSCLHKYCLMR